MGLSEKEISKFLASKALTDAKLVRELEVAPKKTIPYRVKPCVLVGHSKKHCQQKQPHMKQSKLIGKAKKNVKNDSGSKIEKLKKEIQQNITELRKSEDSLRNTSKDLGVKMMRSKKLVMVQKKLYDRLLDFEVERTTGLKNSPLIINTGKNPKRVLKKLPLPKEVQERFERILTGNDELEKLDDRFTDYLIYLEQIKKRRLELHRDNDYADYSKFCFVGPDGVLHKKPSADPKRDTRYYEKVKKKRISSPRTASFKNRNNMKRVRHIELLGKYIHKEKDVPSDRRKHCMGTERVKINTTSPRLERFRRQVLDLQDEYHSGQKQINQLIRELQLRANKPEYQRRCREIRKELCTRIDDVAWKQKEYEPESARLQTMTNRRTFTRIEQAFAATTVIGDTSVEGNVTDLSQSFDQGSGSKLPIKISTKEKIRQLQAMLRQLADEVEDNPDDASETTGWADSDDETEKKANAEASEAPD